MNGFVHALTGVACTYVYMHVQDTYVVHVSRVGPNVRIKLQNYIEKKYH